MTERLDRIEALLERTAEQTAQNRADISRQQSEIDDLLSLLSGTLKAFQQTREEIAESNRRFDILRADAIEDRKRSDSRFETMLSEIRTTNQRITQLEERAS